MIEQLKAGITRSTVDGALVLEYEDMFTGKRSRLSRSQCLFLGRIEIPETRRLPKRPRSTNLSDRRFRRRTPHVDRWTIDRFASNQYQRPCCDRTDQLAYRLATTVCR